MHCVRGEHSVFSRNVTSPSMHGGDTQHRSRHSGTLATVLVAAVLVVVVVVAIVIVVRASDCLRKRENETGRRGDMLAMR